MILYKTVTPFYTMLMSSNQDEAAVHGGHYQDDMVVRIHGVVCFFAVIVCSFSHWFPLLTMKSRSATASYKI